MAFVKSICNKTNFTTKDMLQNFNDTITRSNEININLIINDISNNKFHMDMDMDMVRLMDMDMVITPIIRMKSKNGGIKYN